VACRSNSSRGRGGLGCSERLRVSAEGGGALRHAGVRRGSRAWKKSKGRRGGGSDGLSSGRRQAARHVERGENWGPGKRHEA
jgi:hypothetical protein